MARTASTLAPGAELVAAAGAAARYSDGASWLEATGRTRARVLRADAQEIRAHLAAGTLAVGFHPVMRGSQRMVIDTDSARVEVVGTEFVVSVDDEGGTTVAVSEGTVRVVRKRDGEESLVAAGARLRVAPTDAEGAKADARMERVEPPAARAQAREPATSVRTRAGGETVREAGESVAGGALADSEASSDERPDGELALDRAPAAEDRALRSTSPADAHFARANELIRRGRFDAARHELYAAARSASQPSRRAQAWLQVADSYELEARYDRAAEAYRRAAAAGGRTPQGLNAVYSLARVQERRLGDKEAAKAAYRRYLGLNPFGPLASQALKALCRLGDDTACRP